eukprot:gene7938-9468_t
MLRFAADSFSESTPATVGLDFRTRTINLDGKDLNLQIWDTAGEVRSRTTTISYYRGAHAIFVLYDVTNPESFKNIKQWKREIDTYASENVVLCIIGTKADQELEDNPAKRAVTLEQAEEFATCIDCDVMEVSARLGDSVNKAFFTLASKTYRKKFADLLHERPRKTVEPAKVDPHLFVSLPTLRFAVSEKGNPDLLSCTVDWKAEDFRSPSADFIYQVQKQRIGFFFRRWEDLGIFEKPHVEIGKVSRSVVLQIRVRAGRFATASLKDFKASKNRSWSKWSEPLVLDMKIVVPPSAPAVAPTPQRSLFDAQDWRPHWTPSHSSHYGRKVRICIRCEANINLQIIVRLARTYTPEPDFTAEGLNYLKGITGLIVQQEAKTPFWTQGATSMVFKGLYNDIPVAIKQYKSAFLSHQHDFEFLADPARAAEEGNTTKLRSSAANSADSTADTATLASAKLGVAVLPDQLQMEEYVYRMTKQCPYAVSLVLCRTIKGTAHPFIATELIDQHGTLLNVLQDRTVELSWLWRLIALLQVAQFLEFLHGKNIAHLDLKAENCVVVSVNQRLKEKSTECLIKVFDFNSSSIFGSKSFSEVDNMGRTPSHTPPEFTRQALEKNKSKSFTLDGHFDVYSFGILMAEMASRGLAYSDEAIVKSLTLLEVATVRGERPYLAQSAASPLPPGYEELAALCWQHDAVGRPTAAQLVMKIQEVIAEYKVSHFTGSFALSVCSTGEFPLSSPLATLDPGHDEATVDYSSQSPLYLVVLKAKCFKKSYMARHTVAQRYEREIPGLRAFTANDPQLRNQFKCMDPSGEFQRDTIYQRQPKDPNKYIVMAQYADHLLTVKKEEFIKIMQRLGARLIVLSGSEATRGEIKGKLGIKGAVFGELGVKGAQSGSEKKAMDCSCEFEKPFRTKPKFDESDDYLFYYNEEDWKGIVEARLSPNSPLQSKSVSFNFDSESHVSASIAAKVKHLGLHMGGSMHSCSRIADQYLIHFYTREDYNRCNRHDITLWNPNVVKKFLEYLGLQEYIEVFALRSVRGITLLSENAMQNLLEMKVSAAHADMILDAVQCQINGLTDFIADVSA